MARAKKRYLIVGLGQFGFSVAIALVEEGEDVLAIDIDEARVQEAAQMLPSVAAASGSDPRALKALGVDKDDVAIVSCGQALESSILTTTVLLELGLQTIIAKAINRTHGTILARIGASRVVYPEREAAERLADELMYPDVMEHFRLAKDHSIIELNVPAFLVGETLVSSNLRANFGINVVAIHPAKAAASAANEGTKEERKSRRKGARSSEAFLVAPPPDYEFGTGDVLVILGKDSQIEAFKRHVDKRATD